MSGIPGTRASLSGRTFSAGLQLTEMGSDHIVLEKDTYLVDENNRVIPVPARTVAVLQRDSENDGANTDFSPPEVVQTSTDLRMPPEIRIESDIQAVSVPDSTSMDSISTSLSAAVAHSTESIATMECEVAEATSSDPSTSISLSDMFVQEEEEVMEESKADEAVISASGLVQDPSQSPSKDAAQKPGRKGAQRKKRKVSGSDVESQEARKQKFAVPAAAEKLTPVTNKSTGTKSASSSPTVSSVSASGRPQRSTPRRSVYEMLHGGDLPPQRRSHADSEHEGHSGSGHATKKQKVSNSGAADEREHKQTEGDGKVGSAKGRRGRPAVPTNAQTSDVTSEAGEGTERSASCATSSTIFSASATELKDSSCLSSSCQPATDDGDLVESTSSRLLDSGDKREMDVSQSRNESEKNINDTENLLNTKQKQSRKAVPSNQDVPNIASPEKETLRKKKVVGKRDLDSKAKGPKKSRVSKVVVADESKVPGKPYHYFFTSEDNNCPASDDSDGESSVLAADLASEDVGWMQGRIAELEQQVRRLQEDSKKQENKRMSRCWQDVLTEFSKSPAEKIEGNQMLTRYEQKLLLLDRELDERAAYIRVREGCISRRERRILEKENDLKKRERDLEHQRRLHGLVKFPSESTADSQTLSPTSTESSSATNRKQALEKEVRLELRKQELDRRKHDLEDERKKLAARERELENREHALVDADLMNMASGFTSSRGNVEPNQTNGGTTVEFSDDDDDFGGNSFTSFRATSVSLPFSLDDDSLQEPSEVSCVHVSVSC